MRRWENLTELVIGLAALRAGQYTLVKAAIAGAIVANTLFVLGASFLLGGLKHHVQEHNRINARLQTSLLFLATIAMVIPSAVQEADSAAVRVFMQELSVSLSVLLIAAYALGLVFSLNRKTANIDIRVDPQLVEKIDGWRARQRVAPSRSAAIVYMLEEFLKHDRPGLNAIGWQRLLSRA